MKMHVTLIVEKWQVRPEPKWVLLRKRIVEAEVTPKRIRTSAETFDRKTGAQVSKRYPGSWYRHSIKIPVGGL